MSTAATIRRCIDRCARHKDGRWPWQSEKACAEALAASGSPAIAADVAAAARRIGEWLKTAGPNRDSTESARSAQL